MCKCKLFMFIVALTVLGATGWAYEGYEPLTDGGAGGSVVWVTNLSDSGAGSFHQAVLDLDGTATIIKFDVNGVICPTSEIRITKANVTVDGSSAPAEGITLSGANLGLAPLLGIKTNDVIVTHLRFRNAPKEGIQVWGNYNIIIDHCSITGSQDGAIDINGGTDHITVSRCLFGGDVECHRSYGDYASLHHNL